MFNFFKTKGPEEIMDATDKKLIRQIDDFDNDIKCLWSKGDFADLHPETAAAISELRKFLKDT